MTSEVGSEFYRPNLRNKPLTVHEETVYLSDLYAAIREQTVVKG